MMLYLASLLITVHVLDCNFSLNTFGLNLTCSMYWFMSSGEVMLQMCNLYMAFKFSHVAVKFK